MAESNDTNNEASTPKVPRMMESMGWLTESLLVPRKGKKIEGVSQFKRLENGRVEQALELERWWT